MIIRPTKTIAGREATLDTSNRGVELVLAYAAIGDQGGLIDDTLTALRNERDRVPLYGSRVSPTQLHLDALFENGVNAYWVREVGIFDTNGVMIYFWSTNGSELGHKSANMDWLLGLELHVDEAIEQHVTVNAPSALFTTPATTERRGIIELATNEEAIAGTDSERAITPMTLKAAMNGLVAGTALNADKLDGLDSTDFALAGHSHTLPIATTSVRGIVELATAAEATAGTDTERAVTPFGLAAALAATSGGGTADYALNADKLDGLDSTDFSLKNHQHIIDDVTGLREALDRSIRGFLVKKPSVTTPVQGAVGFSGAMACSAFAVQDGGVFYGTHSTTHWQVFSDANLSTLVAESTSGNLTSWSPSLAASSTFFVRLRHGADNHWSDWSDVVEFSTGASMVNTPSLAVQGAPFDVRARPILSTSAFASSPAGGTHTSTDWRITKASGGLVVHEALGSSSKTTYNVPGGVLAPNTDYIFSARHNGTVGAQAVSSTWANATGKTRLTFLPEIEMARLFASDGAIGDHFGNVVAMNDFGNIALCGSPESDVGGKTDAGAVYYFDYSTSWVQRAKIIAADGLAGDNFGSALAISGDGGIAAVVAHNASGGEGAVYMFTRSGNVWTQAQKITVSNSIKLATVDMSGDGSVLVIGDNAYNNLSSAGKAYVFIRSGQTWTQAASLSPSDSSAGDGFGLAVAITRSPTVGNFHIVIGAPLKASSIGCAYVFAGSGASWTQQAILTPNDGALGGQFGSSVALSNTLNHLVIGAPLASVSGVSSAGAIYPYTHNGSTWLAGQRLVQSGFWGLESGGRFATSVAIASNTAILAGQPGYASGAGRAYYLDQSGGTWVFSAAIQSSSLSAGDAFGVSVAVPRTGSLERALIGAYDHPMNTNEAGSAYVYTI